MRIPLDYYRVLGLPIQATAEQLKQAHLDRTLQLPRREYSELAIAARKSLIDEAYKLLADPQGRQTYDAQFLARAYAQDASFEAGSTDWLATDGADAGLPEVSPEVGEETLRALAAEDPAPDRTEPYTPSIEVDENQFVGALLILLELGEYELVIRLGRPFLTSGHHSLSEGQYGEPQQVLQDIVLTLALACLELGREQWQQRQYESAAESLETGQELLLRETVFPAIRTEIQADLYKLRPYRILELVARPLEQTAERRQGIQLLREMLRDRGGIDGVEDDLSGLSTDDFLRFIQQLRSYLTAGEQQEIFEAEARRPSPVATYLAVYALLARGFAFHQPMLIQRARQLLRRLSQQQDVHLEQAVCALLLGQAEEAGRALDLSQEYEPLAFIREHSQHSPDLLPGLCLYAERWLREEVFNHFRDLADQQTALKDYFADAQVQAYLEAMPLAVAANPEGQAVDMPATDLGTGPAGVHIAVSNMHPLRTRASMTTPPSMAAVGLSASSHGHYGGSLTGEHNGKTALSEPQPLSGANGGEQGLTIAERVSQLSPAGQLQGRMAEATGAATAPSALPNGHGAVHASSPTGAEPRSRSRSPRWDRLAIILILAILGMGLLGFVTVRTLSWLGGLFTGPRLRRPALDISLVTPPVSIPTPPPPEAQISVNDIAERAINEWLMAKRQALSENHDVAVLTTVLVDPALDQWRNRVEGAQQSSWYVNYDHTVNILEVSPDNPGADSLVAQATVREVAEHYEYGIRNLDSSYDETLNMQYSLVRQEGEWFVKEITRLE